ncbi:glycoside hydrolase family 27 protein [Williamsia sterculiae]|uniref:Alpha-galactosidase n=1 Tax=Williamsia sterculiae TaxID=1344003 RepID=A0A1N7DWW9_9NOCA|nr:glycoside hydrolase family 27 protein [Williamsia sterculiae]SIR80342.1 alpha-galactosidase [Williamsia sterculiae]
MRFLTTLTATVLILVSVVGCDGVDDPRHLGGTGVAVPGLPSTPPMGWNSWNSFGCGINESMIRAQADALVSSGMAAAGYRYVVVDDCWYTPARDSNGRLQADPTRFPSGMAALGAYLHSRGLLFGIYAGASDRTCAQLAGTYPGTTGSAGHETTDAQTFASWGVDYLKYDWCSTSGDQQESRFTAMRDALRATGRSIVYSINANSGRGTVLPGARDDWGSVATMSRITNDISATWTSGQGADGYQGVYDIVRAAAPMTQRAGPGRFIDPDMLEIGVGGALTAAQQRSHLALWAMMAAPLIAGNDLTTMDSTTRQVLTNPGVIAIDQDPLVSAASRSSTDPDIWTRKLADGGQAIAVVNPTTATRTAPVDLGALGLRDATVTDVWTGRMVTVTDGRVDTDIAAGDTLLLRTR